MADHLSGAPLTAHPARVELKTYHVELPMGSLAVGVDNIHYDVFLSPKCVELTRSYLLELVRQATGLERFSKQDPRAQKPPDTGTLRKLVADLLQASLTNAKYEKNIELDLLLRISLLKFFTQEISNQFANLLLEGKESIRSRGSNFERSEQAHVVKSRLAELQANRRNVFRQVGQQVFKILVELDESLFSRSRRALFGEECSESYELLKNRLVFVEGGRDDALYLEQYVLLGNYQRDEDRFETFDALLLDFLREFVVAGEPGEEMSDARKAHDALVEAALRTRAALAQLEERRDTLARRVAGGEGMLSRVLRRSDPADGRAALAEIEVGVKHLQEKLDAFDPKIEAAKQKAEFLTEEYNGRLGDYLNEPENARLLFDPAWSGEDAEAGGTRAQLLEEWLRRLEERDLLVHVLASYEVRNLHHDYCPPVHLQQLRKALISREQFKRVEEILKQFPARRFSLERVEDLARKLRHYPREDARAIAVRFAEDFMRLRRDLGNYQRLVASMERINLIRSEKTREVSRLNNSLYEFLLPEEQGPKQDRVVAHAIIKADVRGSTKITHDLQDRGLNPASHFSLHLYEPVKRILARFGAAKVFIEGDAIVLAIYETEANRSHQCAVSKACALARHILAVARAYNLREETSELPRLELGLGIAFQNSPPTYWEDSGSRIMISRAINLSDRLSSCSKVARRLLAQASSMFRVFLFQPVMGAVEDEEAEEFLIRYNLDGIELNEEGFQKLSEEISMTSFEMQCPMPWGREPVTLYYGEVPLGETLEPIVLRKGYVRQIMPDGRIGGPGSRAFYEVCATAEVRELVEAHLLIAARKD